MGIKYEDYCVGCPPELGCLGKYCKYRDVPVWFCDKCEEETDELFEYEGQELCKECLLETVPRVVNQGKDR